MTFPHLGDAHIAGRIFFKELGIDIITPPLNSAKDLELGSSLSPDEMCLPFKLMIANLIRAHEMGADTAVMPATIGPCRLGEYGELLKSILDKHGYRFHWIILDTAGSIGRIELIERLGLLISESECGMREIISALTKTYRLIRQFEKLEKRARISCGYEASKGSSLAIVRECRSFLRKAEDMNEAFEIVKLQSDRLSKVPLDMEKDPVRIMLVGEIYSVIEPFANHKLEETLMERGVCFEKPVTLGWWIRNHIMNPFHSILPARKRNKYMPYSIGGFAKETVSEGLGSPKHGCDGVLQILPVGCMPEIVAKSVLNQISREEGIRVMTVIFDEMGGEAGYITRIEAFIDMLGFAKRKRKEG